MTQNQFVTPGDVIITGSYVPEQNAILDGDKIMSTAIGFYEIEDNRVNVIPLTGLYTPKIDDLIIGKVISHNALSWDIDINSYYTGMLPASDIFGREYSSSKDDLSLKLSVGDIISTRIIKAGGSRGPLLSISGQNLGKIDSGELVKTSPTKAPHLIGKHGSMIQTIEASTNATITIGQNGLIVLKCDDSTGLKKAVESIKMMNEALHNTNLEQKIQNILDGKN
jgi:exosome complex component RRP4